MQPRIGVNLTLRDDRPRGEFIEFVQLLEGLGYDSIWAGESWGREVFTLLTHLACNTTRVHLAAGIANVYSRTPALIAQTIATLDEIAGGRAILGLGSSGEKVIQDWHGVPFRKPLQRTREYVDIVNMALRGDRVNYDGEFFHLRDFKLMFQPLRNHVPIVLAALGPKNIQLTGELADGWAPIYASPKAMAGFRKRLAEGAARRGRDASKIDVRPYTVACVSNDPRVCRELARGHIAFYVGGMGRYYHDLVASYGYVEEARRVKDLWEKRDRKGATAAVTDAMLADLAITGTAEQCRQRAADLMASGYGAPVIYLPHGSSDQVMKETVEGLSPQAFR